MNTFITHKIYLTSFSTYRMHAISLHLFWNTTLLLFFFLRCIITFSSSLVLSRSCSIYSSTEVSTYPHVIQNILLYPYNKDFNQFTLGCSVGSLNRVLEHILGTSSFTNFINIKMTHKLPLITPLFRRKVLSLL